MGRWLAKIPCLLAYVVKSMPAMIVEALDFVVSLLVSAINVALSVLPEVTLPNLEADEGAFGLLNSTVSIPILMSTATALIGMTLLWKLYKFLLKYVQ